MADPKSPDGHPPSVATLKAPDGAAHGDRPFGMGVLDVTPDSFSDGGESMGEAAVDRAQAFVDLHHRFTVSSRVRSTIARAIPADVP